MTHRTVPCVAYALRVYSTSDLASYGTYYYICNAQGDVVKIVHQNGTVKAEYKYDAWGKIRSATGDLAASNPLRYQGYYYDTETGWYYLQSRYYDPIVKRFINADAFATLEQGFLGLNLFAYCNNNPTNNVDQAGTYTEVMPLWAGAMWWLTLVDGPLPIGDIVYGVGIVVLLIVDLALLNEASKSIASRTPDSKAKTASSAQTVVSSTPATPPPDNNQNDRDNRQRNGTPRNNREQNKQIDAIVSKLKLTPYQRRMLHDAISGMNYTYQEVLKIAYEIKGMYAK